MTSSPSTTFKSTTDIDQTDAIVAAENGSTTPLSVVLRRRSTLSPNNPATPKSLDYDADDSTSVESGSDQDDNSSSTGDDIEAVATSKSRTSNCTKKRLLCVAAYTIIAIALITGLTLAFHGKNSSTTSSMHDNEVPPQQKEDFTMNLDSGMEEDFSDEDDDTAFNKPKILEWPELVGMWGENAKARLEEQYGDEYNIVIIPEGSPVTRDFRYDRVRLFVDGEGKIVSTPRVG